MQPPSQDDIFLEKKWRERSTREKSEIITAFLNECGEDASWEEWRDFLHRRQVKGFDWTESAD
jgi:hypothetical protein